MGALSSTCIFAFNYEIHPKGGMGTLSRDYGISVVHTLGYMYMYIHGWVYVHVHVNCRSLGQGYRCGLLRCATLEAVSRLVWIPSPHIERVA